jgi:hypothetical protein
LVLDSCLKDDFASSENSFEAIQVDALHTAAVA